MPDSETSTVVTSALPARRYASLRSDVAGLLADARERAEAALAHELVLAYWRIGERIRTEPRVKTAADRAELIRRLSADLEIGPRTLQRAVAFHRTYAEAPDTALTWAHYRTLLPLPAEQRGYYEQLAVEGALSVRALSLAIDAARHEQPDPERPPGSRSKTIRRPSTPGYVYLASLIRIVDADTLILDIDLGFKVHAHHRIRLAAIDTPPLDTPEGARARRYLQKLLTDNPHLAVQTREFDTYGRYIGHLFCSPRKQPLKRLYETGLHLNQRLLDRRHATPL